jgi:hypothetical protein
MTAPVSTPPSREIGYVVPGTTPGWNYFSTGPAAGDALEEVPELAWPNNIRIFHRMRTDAQIDALISAVVKPLLRLNWQLNPNGASPECVADISQQLNLRVKGDKGPFIQRGRKRFDHAEHLRLTLLAPTVYGHMPFEMQGNVGVDLKWRLSKLMPVLPHTISKMQVNRGGGLDSITQYGDNIVFKPDPIPITQLVMYTWEREGGNWAGRSMMRPLYRYWLLKDRALRIDAMANDRYGLGVPVGTAAPGGDPASMQKMASAVRAVEEGGIGLPNGAKLGVQGIQGTLPDTKGSIRLYNEEMAKSFLAMFMGLGQSEHGNRALGESFVDFFVDALAAFANWYRNVTNQHVIEDIVDWNWGEEENAPLLEWSERDEQPLGIRDLADLIRSGALVVDYDLQNWIRERLAMPAYTGLAPLPTRPSTVRDNLQSQGAEEGEVAPPEESAGTPSEIQASAQEQRRDADGKFAEETLDPPPSLPKLKSGRVRFFSRREG